ncbi:MAG: hypothetical protein HN882_09225 [Planctomycetaceae bacterium]|nr:hypothetical protein [Planctomycetaceae bacterium]
MNYRKQHLAGITIIEVLFSVGIIVTGLLGVAGLIMISGTQMSQGLEADSMSNAGLNAISEFDTRKMRRPDNLLWYNPSTNSFTSVLSSNLYGPGADNRWGTAGVDDDNNGVIDDVTEAGYANDDLEPSPSFCIDPFFIAQQVVDGNPNTHEFNLFPGRPPAANLVQMRRVTLKNPNPAFPTQNLPLSLFQSREIFIAKDDLSISKPPSATELPQQMWIENKAKRLNAAETSWMATLTPNRNREDPQNNNTLEPTDQYLLSIVIFNNRFINYTDANADPEKERPLNITFLNRGFGGGEIQLSAPLDPTTGLSDPTQLELKHGDWVMLSADSNIRYCFRWYRISYIEDETPINQINAAGEYYRHATLQGPDWSRPEWHNGTYTTHVTFIPGVIGVFEKTIRMESTSLY